MKWRFRFYTERYTAFFYLCWGLLDLNFELLSQSKYNKGSVLSQGELIGAFYDLENQIKLKKAIN